MRKKTTQVRNVISTALAISVLISGGIVNADSPMPGDTTDVTKVEQIIELADEVSAPVDPLANLLELDLAPAADGSLVATDGANSVTIPSESSQGIGIEGVATAVSFGLPGSSTEVQATDDHGVFEGVLPDTSLIASAADDTAQVRIVIEGPQSPTAFRFPVELGPEGRLEKNPDGSVSIWEGDESAAAFLPPWAADAAGNSVATHFEVEGNELVQIVEHQQGAVYPVVADPAVTINCGIISCSAYISRKWTKTIGGKLERYANASVAAIGTAAGVACAPIGGIGAVVCAGAALIYGAFLVDQFLAAKRANQCIRIRYTITPWGIPTATGVFVDNSKYCKNS